MCIRPTGWRLGMVSHWSHKPVEQVRVLRPQQLTLNHKTMNQTFTKFVIRVGILNDDGSLGSKTLATEGYISYNAEITKDRGVLEMKHGEPHEAAIQIFDKKEDAKRWVEKAENEGRGVFDGKKTYLYNIEEVEFTIEMKELKTK